jgi:hypothetical protein
LDSVRWSSVVSGHHTFSSEMDYMSRYRKLFPVTALATAVSLARYIGTCLHGTGNGNAAMRAVYPSRVYSRLTLGVRHRCISSTQVSNDTTWTLLKERSGPGQGFVRGSLTPWTSAASSAPSIAVDVDI